MMEEMRRLRPTGTGLKSIVECGGSGQGRRCLVSFLRRTGLMGKTKQAAEEVHIVEVSERTMNTIRLSTGADSSESRPSSNQYNVTC